jgi:hypothetical protein
VLAGLDRGDDLLGRGGLRASGGGGDEQGVGFAAGLITSAALTASSRIRRRAAAWLGAAAACSEADGIRLSLVTIEPDSGAGATTASGILYGLGEWNAPT